MEVIKVMALDDERGNLEYLELLLGQHFPQLHIAALCDDPYDGLVLLRERQPQLVFMDIDMPGMSGFEVLKRLEPLPFEVIFVTAYNQYAIDAFDCNAVGYLTKPVETQKFISTVAKAIRRIQEQTYHRNLFSLLEASMQKKGAADKIPLATGEGLVFVKLDEIMYCESSGNYTQFHLVGNKTILVSRQLGEYDKLLPGLDFCRIHESYIINLSYLKEYIKGSGGSVVLENGAELPVAQRRKEALLNHFEGWLRKKG